MPTKKPLLSPALKSAIGWTRPEGLPAIHPLSTSIKLLGDFAQIQTGIHWSEFALQSFFESISKRCPDARNALDAAKAVRLDVAMKKGFAEIKLAEDRRKILLPILEEFENLAGDEVASAFGSIDVFDALILDKTAPAPVSGNEKIALNIEFSGLLSMFPDSRKDFPKLSELAGRLMDAGRFDLLGCLEGIFPILISNPFDFEAKRTEWVYRQWPELKAVRDARCLVAEKTYSFGEKVAGIASIAMSRAIEDGIDFYSLGKTATETIKALEVMPAHPAFEKNARKASGFVEAEIQSANHVQSIQNALREMK